MKQIHCAIVLLFSSASVMAADNCTPQAQTALEETYCAIRNKGQGGQLPTLNEFRKNPKNVQRLLLKSPARKAGVKIPPAAAKLPKQSNVSATKKAVETPTPKPVPTQAEHARPASTTSDLRRECQLQSEQIICGGKTFHLQGNLPNNQLPHQVFTPENQLILPARNHPRYQNVSDSIYLSESYAIYIKKMLELGLGGSSSSYTRFVAIYEEIKAQGGNFAKRFHAMYELLKLDKASNEIQARYDKEIPASMAQCMPVNADIIVCDNVAKNWIYSAQ